MNSCLFTRECTTSAWSEILWGYFSLYAHFQLLTTHLTVVCDLSIYFILSIWYHEITINQGILINYVFVGNIKSWRHLLSHQTEKPFSILIVDETILKDSTVLVKPQSKKIQFGFQFFRLCHEHALKDFGEVAKIESVVTFRWCGEKLDKWHVWLVPQHNKPHIIHIIFRIPWYDIPVWW